MKGIGYFQSFGIFKRIWGFFLEFVSDYFRNCLGIFVDFFGILLGNSLGNLWDFLVEFFGKLFQYWRNWFVCQYFSFCQDFVSMHMKDKFRSLEVQEASSSHIKTLNFMQIKDYHSKLQELPTDPTNPDLKPCFIKKVHLRTL